MVVLAVACLLIAGWNFALANEPGPAQTQAAEDVSHAAAVRAAELVARASVTRVQPDNRLDKLFADYGDTGQGWTGGDGGASVRLPDGRVFWAFSDTWVGPVLPDGLRAPNVPLVSNVAVIQDHDQFTTLYGGSAASPQPFMATGLLPGTGYWNNGAIVSNNTLYVSYSAYNAYQPGFAYQLIDTVFAAYSLPELSLESVTPITLGPRIKWGVSMLNDGGYTYIYGTGFTGTLYGEQSMYVARAPHGNVLGPWQYYNGTSWSADASDAAPLTNIVRDPYSVGKLDGVYVLFTTEDAPLSTQLQAYFAPTPVGPFSNGENIYSTALPEQQHGANPDSIYEYGAYLHPEFTNGTTVVVSYQVNSFSPEGWLLARLIRPRYIDVTIRFEKHRKA